jgi:transposase-like protein
LSRIGVGGFQMKGVVRARYTLEFKQEAMRLVRGGQTVCSVAKEVGSFGSDAA